MSIRALAVIASLAVLFALAGCSGGTPVATDFNGKVANTEGTIGEGVFMRAQLHIDLDSMTAQITPYRNSAAVGDLFADLEITSFLIYPFCPDATCLYVKGLGIVAGTPPDISVTVGVRHPFAKYAGDPPGPNNRADLDLFDLRVYLVNNGGTAPNPAPETVTGLGDVPITFTPNFILNADGYDDGADAKVVNAADGLDLTETTEVTSYTYANTTMQPYLRAFEGTLAEAVDPFTFVPGSNPVAKDNRMSHGESDEVTFTINLEPGAGAIDFDLAIAGTFGASAQGKLNRTPANVRYFKSFRAIRPFIGLGTPAVTDGVTGTSAPTLNFWISHPWAGLAAAADEATYKAQANNGELLPVGAVGPGLADLTFKCRLVDVAGVNPTVDYAVLPTGGGTGTDADPWTFTLSLEDPANPGTPIPNGTYNAYIYVKANVGTLTYPFNTGTDNYTLYFGGALLVQTV